LPSKPSIAVLPFANLSGDSPSRRISPTGMLLEIVEALSRIKSIFVIASSSSLSFKGNGVTAARRPARQLGVRYVLEGSVRKAVAAVRIGVQLIDAPAAPPSGPSGSKTTFDDVFALQDKVALAVRARIERPSSRRKSGGRRRARRRTWGATISICVRALSALPPGGGNVGGDRPNKPPPSPWIATSAPPWVLRR